MVEVAPKLHIGNAADFESMVRYQDGWSIVHACKEPYHRQLLGYVGRGAPKDHPDYLFAVRGNRLFLNLVDADDPAYIPKQIVDTSLQFIDQALKIGNRVLVHCNQGESRSPSLGLLYLAVYTTLLPKTSLRDAETEFIKLYSGYNPKAGMRGFLSIYWNDYLSDLKR